MSDLEKNRTREREQIPFGVYEQALRSRVEFHERQRNGRLIVKNAEVIKQLGRQGYIEYFLRPTFEDIPLRDWYVFAHDVKKHSGRHTHQGGLVLFVLEGKGWTVVDGVRYDWKEGDLVLLPLKPGGVEHQHFNADPEQGCKWLAFINVPMWDQGASQLMQGEAHEDFKKKYGLS